MAQWASREAADSGDPPARGRPVAGTRLDQILADLQKRPYREPETEASRNVTPLPTPFRAEIQALQASIDQLSDRVDSQHLLDAIAALSDKFDSLHARCSLGEAETRLLRSIRRSLDDLLYQLNIPQNDPERPQPAPVAAPVPPVFGRRALPPEAPRRASGVVDTPQVEPRIRRAAASGGRSWPGTGLIRQYPLASVAAAAVFAIMLAQGVTVSFPRQSDITGSIRQAVTPAPRPKAAPEQAGSAAAAIVKADPGIAPSPAAATPPTLTYAPAPAPAAIPAPQAAPAQLAAARPVEEPAGSAAYQAGVRLADGPTRDYRGAIQMFEKAGDLPAAQFRLALLYERGQGAAKNPTLARALYQRAAERGHIRAMHNLGVLYADGPDGRPDYANAAEWFRRAADHGLRDSQYNLATLMARGLGVERKPAAAYTWFALAAAQGDAEAGRQRDEIGRTLDPATLKSARAAADNFRPKAADPAVNQTAINP